MKKLIILMITAGLALSLTGCAGMSKQDIGVLTGAAAGGLLGSRFGRGGGRILATVGGAVAGGFIGGAIGRHMDRTDRATLNHALASPSNKTYVWNSRKDRDMQYAVTPAQPYYSSNNNNQPCRDYTMKVTVAGHVKPQTVVGQACRMADGTWETVK